MVSFFFGIIKKNINEGETIMTKKKDIKKIGIVMPISERDGCTEKHWKDVKEIIIKACKSIKDYEVEAELVSEDDSNDIIASRIITNLYSSDLVVCDVSTSNPNVMFELGLRLAFAKPIVIIKDDKTGYNFDVSSIEHLCYDRTLRYQSVEIFMNDLAKKATEIIRKADSGNYKSYLETLKIRNYSAVDIAESEVNFQSDVIEILDNLSMKVSKLEKNTSNSRVYSYPLKNPYSKNDLSKIDMQNLYETLKVYNTISPDDLNIPDAVKFAVQNMVFESMDLSNLQQAIGLLSDMHGWNYLPF